MRKLFLLLIPVVFLLSCAGSNIKAPETTEDKINYATATLTGLTKTVTDNLKAGTISVEDAVEFLKVATNAQTILLSARAALLTNEEDALEKWREAHLLLIQLNQKYNKYGGVE